MKNPLFQVISPTTALVTNSSHIICYVLEHIRGNNEDPRCPLVRASGILFIVAALRCLLVHAVLQNRNFLKQNAYNEKRRFSQSYQCFEPLFEVSLILRKFTHFYANLRHLAGNWRKLWRKPANFVQ